ncbi:hypothetical protein TIFTF001_001173 [Ficus carica]|uniref:Uncharacterized protein n=1 Tax=Ficus carica TaxID=3494 RepID=A0AA88CQY9_FICCA|nr:hypothetical protein TIFTF001_001173 [Ficus carica]
MNKYHGSHKPRICDAHRGNGMMADFSSVLQYLSASFADDSAMVRKGDPTQVTETNSIMKEVIKGGSTAKY